MCGDRFSSSTTCSRWRHETEPGQLDQSLSCRFWKVATHPALVVVTLATTTYASPLGVASLAGMNDGGIWSKSVRLFQTCSTSPPIDAYAPRWTTGDRGLIRYIYECTRPDDRVWVLSDLFAFPYYAERRVVGHIYWKDGMLANPEFERRMIEKVDSAEVPIIIGLGGPGPLAYLESYPLVHQYVAQRYLNHYAIPERTCSESRSSGCSQTVDDNRRARTSCLGCPVSNRQRSDPLRLRATGACLPPPVRGQTAAAAAAPCASATR